MLKKIVFILTPILILVSTFLVFFIAPIPIKPEEVGGDPNNFKIFYFHLPIAISAYISFTVVFVSSILYLKSKNQQWDIVGFSAAEVGSIFAFLTLVSGSLWAKSAWGDYWIRWDVRLNTSLILFLIYLSYLMIRQAVEEAEKRARLSAVFGIVGFISVPISFFSVRIVTQKMHPCVIPPCPGSEGGGIGGVVLYYLLVNFAAYFLLTASLILLRIDNERMKEKVNKLKIYKRS